MTATLSGRRVLVTGASSGIGRASALAAAGAGARVAVLARRVELLADLAAETGGVAVPADVTDVLATRQAVDRAAEQLGGLDAVVAAAGFVRPGLVADAEPSTWQQTFDVNVLGTLHAVQAAIPHLRSAGRGDVVTLSSMSGRRLKSTEMGVYAASKAAVHVVSEALRRELSPDGIRVTTLAPGLVDTPLLEGAGGAVAARLRERASTAGLTADDVARAIVDVLAAPPHVLHVEVALMSIGQ